MTSFLVAPTERPPISSMGPSSSLPERYGVDVFWTSTDKLTCGVQRKTVSDLVASVRDGRLGREVEQMRALDRQALVIEGTPHWTADGTLHDQYSKWTQAQHWGVLFSAQEAGVWLADSRTGAETVQRIEHLAKRWDHPAGTSSLLNRAASKHDGWGRMDDRATAVYVLSGLPGIGLELAERIYDKFGRAPISLSCEDDELLEVEGLGPKRLAQIKRALG